MQDSQRGVLVTHVAVTSCSDGVLQNMDVLMKFDGLQVRTLVAASFPFNTGPTSMHAIQIEGK